MPFKKQKSKKLEKFRASMEHPDRWPESVMVFDHRQSLADLASVCGTSTDELWRILSGGTTYDIRLARAIARHTLLDEQSLVYNQLSILRQGVAVWVGCYCGRTKHPNTFTWRLINSGSIPRSECLKRLCEFTGTDASFWKLTNHQANWFISDRGRQIHRNRSRKSGGKSANIKSAAVAR